MQDISKITVVDFNSCLGERSVAFLKHGFNVLAAVEEHPYNADICRSVLGDSVVLQESLETMDMDKIPSCDILTGSFAIPHGFKKPNYAAINKKIDDYVFKNAPKLLIFQIPSLLFSKHDFDFLSIAVRRRYYISYKTFRESEYSGFPVVGSQTYILATRYDLPWEHTFFPPVKFMNFDREPFLESPEKINSWYRNSFRTDNLSDQAFEKSGYYARITRNKSKYINLIRYHEMLLCDDIGPRRITHNEYAALKNIHYADFNSHPKRSFMYQTIYSAANLYIFNPIVELVKNYFDKLPVYEAFPSEFPKPEPTELKKSSAKRNNKLSKKQSKESLFKLQNRLTALHIDMLKGLKNLDIRFSKNLTAIMGVNGVGKSTVLHALACVFAPIDDGENYQFNFFFTPTPDASWQNSSFNITYFDESKQKELKREYKKKSDRWSPPYSTRPARDIFYLGITSGLPEIERERQTSYIHYLTSQSDDKIASRIISSASEILNKDYKELTNHKTKKKVFFGVRTHSDITYSSLSMGAGEQRVLKILDLAYRIKPHSMILIDEIDLLLHASALIKLLRKLDDIASRKDLQIIFTTHSLIMNEVKDIVDIKYLKNTPHKTLVYNTITPDIVFDISQKSEQPLTVYVEDDLAAAIVTRIASSLNLCRHTKIKNIGSAQNAFTVAAAIVLEDRQTDNVLIVTDGDVNNTDEKKRKQLNKLLSGTEASHDEKIESALSIITQFNLPENTPPEKYIYDMLTSLDSESEIKECASFVKYVDDSHGWLNQIVERMNQKREVTLHAIIELVSEHNDWDKYTENVRNWFIEKRNYLTLN